MRTSIIALAAASLLLASPPGLAQQTPATPSDIPVTDLPTVTVPPVKSPPLWLFTKGNKQLIVLGTQVPLPESGVLITDPIKSYIAQSQAVLTGPGLKSGDSVGFLQSLTLVGSMRKAQRNDNGQTLSEVVPAEVYQRWASLKAEYLGNDSGVEKLRPMYAAFELYTAALKQQELTENQKLGQVIGKATDAAGMERVDARYGLPVQNLRNSLKAFEVSHADDVRCLDQTLQTLKAYIQNSPSAADAWSVGDMERYRAAEALYTPIDACWARLTNEAIGRSVGVANPYDQVASTWHAAIRQSLVAHDRVFTTLPTRDLLNGTGLAGKLRADGFSVTELFSEQQ